MKQPKLLSKVWASAGLKNDIPAARTNDIPQGSATYEDGFPSITMTPIAMGGKAPAGKDMNGILSDLSAHAVYQSMGGFYKFDADFAKNIGGYPRGAVLISDDFKSVFVSLIDQNSVNFNSSAYAGKWDKVADADTLKKVSPLKNTLKTKNTTSLNGHTHEVEIDSSDPTTDGITKSDGYGENTYAPEDFGYSERDFNKIHGKSLLMSIHQSYINGFKGAVSQVYTGLVETLKRKWTDGTSIVQKVYDSNRFILRFGSHVNGSTDPTWSKWQEPLMTDAETGLVERDIATTGTISTTGNGRTARLGTSTSDVYLFNSKNNSYLQSKDEGYLAFDNNPILLSRQLGTTNLDTLKDPIHYGLWGNPTNAIATADRNYPTLKAGSLLVMLSANGVQQIYSIFDTKSIYKRNQKLDGGWYNWVDVTAVEWSEVSNKPATATRWPTTGEIGAISKTGDTATGNYYFNNSHFQISRDNVTSGQWWGGLNLRADVDGLETGLGVRHEGPRGIQLGMYGVINDGHKAKWSLNLCQPGNNAFGDNDRVMEVIYNGGIWTKVYGWLHDHFAKQDDINNVWNELNNTYRKNRYRHQHYPHHYNGSDVFDIPVADNSVMRVIVMNVTSNGYTRVLLPEAYNGLCIVQATDVGGGRKVVGANIQNGTVVEIHNGGEVVGLNILTIGWYGW